MKSIASSNSPERYEGVTISPDLAKAAIDFAENRAESKVGFYNKPVSTIIAIATEHLR